MVNSGEASGDAHVPAIKVSIGTVLADSYSTICQRDSYKGQAAISTPADLRLVHVNENLRMSQWPSTSVTGYCPCPCPSYGLLVNETDGGFWLRLHHRHQSQPSPPHHPLRPKKVLPNC